MPVACIYALLCNILFLFFDSCISYELAILWTSKKNILIIYLVPKIFKYFVWRIFHIEENMQNLIYRNANTWSNYLHVSLILSLKDELTVLLHPWISFWVLVTSNQIYEII